MRSGFSCQSFARAEQHVVRQTATEPPSKGGCPKAGWQSSRSSGRVKLLKLARSQGDECGIKAK